MEDELFHLREQLGDDAFPRSAAHYLDGWASDDTGWFHKYYPAGTDEPHHDITPATEKVIVWLSDLQERHFIGTESRLLTVFRARARQYCFGFPETRNSIVSRLISAYNTVCFRLSRKPKGAPP